MGALGLLLSVIVLAVPRSAAFAEDAAVGTGAVAPVPGPTAGMPVTAPARPEEGLSTCITAIASLSDPAKLGTLGERAANPRLKKIIYWLAVARDFGADPAGVIDQAQRENRSEGTGRAPLVKASLLRNLKIADGLGLLTPENRQRLRRGAPPVVTRGPYAGQTAEVDHIVPLAHAFEIGNELANLEMLPAALNRAKGAKVGERQLAVARQMRAAGLIIDATMDRIEKRFRPSATARFEAQESEVSPAPAAVSTPGATTLIPGATPAAMGTEDTVWVNTRSHVYHLPASRWYGRTEAGKYLSEKDALAEGDRAARNHQ